MLPYIILPQSEILITFIVIANLFYRIIIIYHLKLLIPEREPVGSRSVDHLHQGPGFKTQLHNM